MALVAALWGAAPASADCVSAGVWVNVGATKRTIVADGTCVAPTPLPAGPSAGGYYGEPTTAGVGYKVTVPFP